MYELKSVDVMSCAKIAGVFYFCLTLLFIPIVLVMLVTSAGSPQPYSPLGAIGLVLLAIFAPVLYGLLGFVFGAITAWLYNVTAKWVGGIRLNLRSEKSIEAPSEGIGTV